MLIGIALCACLVLPSAFYSVSSGGSDETMEITPSSVDMVAVYFSAGLFEEWPERIPDPISYPPDGAPLEPWPEWERPCTLAVYLPEII